jgi:hypothetical protein
MSLEGVFIVVKKFRERDREKGFRIIVLLGMDVSSVVVSLIEHTIRHHQQK